MNNIMSVVFASDNETKLNELTIHRTTASLPFCGRYRFIDFTLSNLVNSQITTIGIITRSNYSSLMDHIRMGRDWDLNRKNSGIAVFPPFVSNTSRSMFKGKVEALYGILDYITKASEDYVIITNSNIAANIDFDSVFNFHIENKSDITMVTYMAKANSSKKVVVESEKNGKVSGIKITNTSTEEELELGLNIYLMHKNLLVELLTDAYERGNNDFERTILQQNVGSLKIFAFKQKGYAAVIDDVKSYYTESMNILDPNIRNDLFYSSGKIFTKVKDSVPTKYLDGAIVSNSLIADGCIINGKVENSILFRGVTVEKGAEIKDSIIMENGTIKKHSSVSYTITDKDVTISENKTIGGSSTYPVVIVKNKVV